MGEIKGRLEDIECPIFNEDWISINQGVIKGMGGNPAEVKSPGLKVQILRLSPTKGSNEIYCPRYISSRCECGLREGKCLFD